jgi:hypothetical protein
MSEDQRKFIRDWYPAENWGNKMEQLYKKVSEEFKITLDQARELVHYFDSK